MKKLIMLLTATFLIAVAVNAQSSEVSSNNDMASLNKQESLSKKEKKEQRMELRKMEGKKISYQAKEEFIDDFGNIPVSKWKKTDYFEEATFTKDGEELTAFYDTDTKLVGTTCYKTFQDIPAAGQKYINSKYKNYSKGQVVFFDDNEFNETDMSLYGIQFDDADNYFVELKKDNKTIVVKVNMDGDVSFFKELS